MTRRRLSGLLLASLTMGCASTGADLGVDPDLAVTAATDQTGVIVGAGEECVFTQDVGLEALGVVTGLVSAVLPKLVDQGVTALVDYLERRRDERKAEFSSSSSARGAAELYGFDGQPALSCLMVYRGKRGKPQTTTEVWTPAKLAKLGLAGPPDFFLETTLLFSSDGAAMRLAPLRLEYRRTAARRTSGKKDVLVAGFLEGVFAEGGAALKAARFGSFQMYFPALAEQTVWEGQDLLGISTQWIPLPAPTRNEAGTAVVSRVPLSVFVNVHETENEGDLLLGVLDALAETTSEEKDDISKTIADEIARRLGLETEEDEPGDAGGGGGGGDGGAGEGDGGGGSEG